MNFLTLKSEVYFWLTDLFFQIDALRRGLLKVVPQAVLDLLTWQELEKRVCGDPEITVEALKKCCKFSPTCCNSHLKHFILALVILRSSYMLTCLPFSMLVPYLLHLHACASISVPLLPTLPCLTLPFLILHYALLPYPTLRCLQRLYPTPLVCIPISSTCVGVLNIECFLSAHYEDLSSDNDQRVKDLWQALENFTNGTS